MPMTTNQDQTQQIENLQKRIAELEASLAEAGIQEVSHRIDQIIEFLPDATFVINHEGKVIAWNQAIEEMTSVSKADMIGKGNYEYTLPFYGQRHPILIDLAFMPDAEFEKQRYDVIYRNGDTLDGEVYVPATYGGKGAYLWGTASRLRDGNGNIVGAIESIRDITNRKAAENALKESETLFRTLAEHAPMGISIMHSNFSFKYLNPRFVDIFGYTIADIPDKWTWFQKAYADPKFRDEMMLYWQQELMDNQEEGNIRERTVMVRCKDGQEKLVRIQAVIMAQGRHLLTYEDITERNQLEENLTQARKLESVGTLAGGIAHNFNNLMMSIQGYTSLMIQDMETSHPHYEQLKRIEAQIQRGADLTKELLGFAQGGRYQVKSMNINDLISKTSSIFSMAKKEFAVFSKLQENLWTVEADAGQMEQVLMNLYVNAWQAMPGGGDIYLETQNVFLSDDEIARYGIQPGLYVQISVVDTGVGMNEKTRERIFDPFFTTKAMGRGTGLGLAMVYGIIRGHGGAINVTSELGHGTTFTIYLPASDKNIVVEKTVAAETVKGMETILLIDDEPINLEVSGELLESLGYRVYLAGGGQEGLAIYEEKRDEIDMVILDMVMPGISGGETFDRLRRSDPDIKVLLCSGYSINGQAQNILDRGCNGFIQKPYKMSHLSQKIRELLDS
ncbi:MAG TPA: hypothetical protein DCG53_14375 [Syntrophus sp. (in: bacteria)]|nr:hypothetical protein [Syntrophus sp. (in: bacteria)]